MKPISNETKARYFSLYRGQKSEAYGSTERVTGLLCDHIAMAYDTKSSLSLRPVSSLNDLEVMQIAKIHDADFDWKIVERTKSFIVLKSRTWTLWIWLKEDEPLITVESLTGGETPYNILQCYQYLQSIGIALPYMEYSVSDLVEAGVIKLVE